MSSKTSIIKLVSVKKALSYSLKNSSHKNHVNSAKTVDISLT